MREKLYYLLEGEVATRAQLTVRLAIQALIVLNVAAVILGTVEPIATQHALALLYFEWASVAIFTIEYATRVAVCTVDPAYREPIRGRVRFALSPLALVDLLAIAPAYLPFFAADMRSVRALRLLRVFRIFKLARYSRAVRSLGQAIESKLPELGVMLFTLTIILVFASSILHWAERDAQPEAFSSIPAAAWWAIATLTTVGYGDITPITPLGKLAAAMVALLGIGLFALPAGLLGSAFVNQLSGEPSRCPHCGGEIENAS